MPARLSRRQTAHLLGLFDDDSISLLVAGKLLRPLGSAPKRAVEATIALSIVFVAAEILRGRAGKPGLTQRAPWVVAFAFGLMHGLGFASGLSEAGLPVAHIPTALFFFSIGVETGHFLFIGVVLSMIALLSRTRIRFPRWSELVPPYAIGTIAMFWVIQRTLSFYTF